MEGPGEPLPTPRLFDCPYLLFKSGRRRGCFSAGLAGVVSAASGSPECGGLAGLAHDRHAATLVRSPACTVRLGTAQKRHPGCFREIDSDRTRTFDRAGVGSNAGSMPAADRS